MKIRIASRKSKMAMSQTNRVIDLLKAANASVECEIVPITSDGCYDKFKGDIRSIGGKGVFIKALEIAMLNDEADIAVHSLKDVPADEDFPEGLMLAATLERNDIRDAAVTREDDSFAALRPGSKVGTSSLRRASQLKASFPYLEVVPLRGNADTRIGKVDSGEVDAAILAKSGLERIEMAHRIDMTFEPDIMCPAVGQGAVCIEARTDKEDILALIAKINHQPTFDCIVAERALLKKLNADCHSAVGAHAEITQSGENMRLIAMVASHDGQTVLWARHKQPVGNPEALGEAAGEDLINQGAEALLHPQEEAA